MGEIESMAIEVMPPVSWPGLVWLLCLGFIYLFDATYYYFTFNFVNKNQMFTIVDDDMVHKKILHQELHLDFCAWKDICLKVVIQLYNII